MKKLYFIMALALWSNLMVAQDCGNAKLSTELLEKKNRDSVYKIDVQNRIDFFATLNQDILPKYTDLKNTISNAIEVSDFEQLLELKCRYNNNCSALLNEMRENQDKRYKNVTAYSIINSIILLETLAIYPDSYAMLFNPNGINTADIEKDRSTLDKMYTKYNAKLQSHYLCFQKLNSEMKLAKSQHEIVEIFQNNGHKTEDDVRKCNLLDLLIWSLG